MFADRLHYLRKMNNKKQQEVADYLGITRPAYCAYETDRRKPDYVMLEKIADYFNVSLDYLVGRDEKTGKPDLQLFRFRLYNGMLENKISLSKAADYCSIKESDVQKMLENPKGLPSTHILYKLAEMLNVTPDYLAGFTNDPQGFSPYTPKRKELADILEDEVFFDGMPITEEEKQSVYDIMNIIKKNRKKNTNDTSVGSYS